MKWNLYNDTIGEWGEVLIKQDLTAHAEKVASETELGHIKIDGTTLVLDTDGTVKVNDAISNSYNPTVYFNVGGAIRLGRIDDAYFSAPFNCKIKEINISFVQISNQELKFNLQKTTDFVTYDDVFPVDFTVSPNTHHQSFTVTTDVTLDVNELVFIDIVDTDELARNMLLTFKIEKI